VTLGQVELRELPPARDVARVGVEVREKRLDGVGGGPGGLLGGKETLGREDIGRILEKEDVVYGSSGSIFALGLKKLRRGREGGGVAWLGEWSGCSRVMRTGLGAFDFATAHALTFPSRMPTLLLPSTLTLGSFP